MIGARQTDSKNGASLIFICKECKTLRFSSTFVPNEININKLTILSKNGEEITLGEIEGDSADVYVSGIFVFGMP